MPEAVIGSPQVGPPKKDQTKEKEIAKSVQEAVNKVNKGNVIEIKSRDKSKEDDSVPLIVKLTNVYRFEGKEYNEIDLSGIKDLTTVDLQAVDKMFYGDGNIAPINEMSNSYCMLAASRASKLPIELFESLKANDSVKVKNSVSHFLLS